MNCLPLVNFIRNILLLFLKTTVIVELLESCKVKGDRQWRGITLGLLPGERRDGSSDVRTDFIWQCHGRRSGWGDVAHTCGRCVRQRSRGGPAVSRLAA